MTDTITERPANLPAATEEEAVARARSTDVATLLGLGKAGAYAVAGLFVFTNIVFTAFTLDKVASPWPSLVAMVLVSAGGILIVLPHRGPIPVSWALAIVFIVATSTALINWQIVLEDGAGPGKEAWHLGANAWLMFFTTMRGRTAFAWVAYLIMASLTLSWALQDGPGLKWALFELPIHAAILLVSTLFTRALRNTSRRINALNLRSVELAAAAAAADAEQQIRHQRLDELAEIAIPLLRRITTANSLTDSDRIDFLLAEATLRDSVRARALHLPEIVHATAAARSRGVEVTLLDDRGGGLPTEAAMRLLTARVTESLRNVDRGSLTIRLAPAGRAVAASIVVQSRGETRRIELDEQGEPVEALPPAA